MLSTFEILTLTLDQKVKGVWLSGIKGEEEYKRWHLNGQIYAHLLFKNYKLNGESKWYDEDGILYDHAIFKNGVRIETIL